MLEQRKLLTDEQLLQTAELCGRLDQHAEDQTFKNSGNKLSAQERKVFQDAGISIVERIWNTDSSEKPSGYGGFSSARLAAIAPYVINTGNNGQFSADGKFSTTELDLSNIFKTAENMHTKWCNEKKSAVRNIVIYSHGGLVSEARGLKTAESMLSRWLENGVYPINIVWQSGAAETIGYIKADRKAREAAAGGDVVVKPPESASGMIGFSLKRTAVILPSDFVENAARKKIAPVWSEMKDNALSISGLALSSKV